MASERARQALINGGIAAACAALVAAGVLALAGRSGGDEKPSAAEIMKRMRYYSESLGVDCDYCHVTTGGKFAYDVETPRMKTARWMEQHLVRGLVTREGHRPIDCHTCHDGRARFLPSSP